MTNDSSGLQEAYQSVGLVAMVIGLHPRHGAEGIMFLDLYVSLPIVNDMQFYQNQEQDISPRYGEAHVVRQLSGKTFQA